MMTSATKQKQEKEEDTDLETTCRWIAQWRMDMEYTQASGASHSIIWRMDQLNRIERMVQNHWEEWIDALYKDLGKSRIEAIGTELNIIISEIRFVRRNLRNWMQPQDIPSPLLCFPGFTQVRTRPRGVVLIIGPFNYPVLLVLQVLVGAIAAGNSAILKPSELCTNVAKLFQKLVPQYLESGVCRCVTGGIPETTHLLQQYSWGLVFFTGSPKVGSLIATAAAKTLSPVVLELGGKCPCYIDAETCPPNSSISNMAQRIVWSKIINAGQTCAATDHLIVSSSSSSHDDVVFSTIVAALKKSMQIQCGGGGKNTYDPFMTISSSKNNFDEDESTNEATNNSDILPPMGRIVSRAHAQRLFEMLVEAEQDPSTRIVMGGSQHCNVDHRFIAPTILINPPKSCRLVREEIFGPILPIFTVSNRNQAIECMQSMSRTCGTPLCLYVFTTSTSVFDEIVQKVPAGSAVRNDCLVHLASPHIPFGGLGRSGYGNYHGKYTFDTFSHVQPVLYRPCGPGTDLGWLRFYPFHTVDAFIMTRVVAYLPSVPVLHLRQVSRIGRKILTVGSLLAMTTWLIQTIISTAWPDNHDHSDWILEKERLIILSISSWFKIRPTHVVANLLETTAAWLRNETDRAQCKMNKNRG
jgi:acyl-CoA reductase-like NAD-dependent aldehyde dehydrogenase